MELSKRITQQAVVRIYFVSANYIQVYLMSASRKKQSWMVVARITLRPGILTPPEVEWDLYPGGLRGLELLHDAELRHSRRLPWEQPFFDWFNHSPHSNHSEQVMVYSNKYQDEIPFGHHQIGEVIFALNSFVAERFRLVESGQSGEDPYDDKMELDLLKSLPERLEGLRRDHAKTYQNTGAPALY